MKKAEKRKAEVDRLFAKLYEDWAAGRITEYNFNMLTTELLNAFIGKILVHESVESPDECKE